MLLIDKVKYIKFSRFKFYENILNYISVNRILNLKSRITFIIKFKYNNNFIISDILNYNSLSEDRIALY